MKLPVARRRSIVYVVAGIGAGLDPIADLVLQRLIGIVVNLAGHIRDASQGPKAEDNSIASFALLLLGVAGAIPVNQNFRGDSLGGS